MGFHAMTGVEIHICEYLRRVAKDCREYPRVVSGREVALALFTYFPSRVSINPARTTYTG